MIISVPALVRTTVSECRNPPTPGIYIPGSIKDKHALQPILSQVSTKEIKHINMPEYDTEDYYNDIMKVTKGKSAPNLARQLVNKSYETIQWMIKQGVEFELNENQSFNNDLIFNFTFNHFDTTYFFICCQ